MSSCFDSDKEFPPMMRMPDYDAISIMEPVEALEEMQQDLNATHARWKKYFLLFPRKS